MSTSQESNFLLPPIVIGGVGGSGTRLIAEYLRKLNIFIGHDLNSANDNLLFTLIFKRAEVLTTSNNEFNKLIDLFISSMTGSSLTKQQCNTITELAKYPRNQHSLEWLQERKKHSLKQKQKINLNICWGWKEPNTHIIMDRLTQYFPNMKYIHVARNGLDMAYSTNQNQLELWGRNVLGDKFEITPYYSLRYWCEVHKKLDEIKLQMKDNFYLLNYDNFCTTPQIETNKLLNFLDIDASSNKVEQLKALINKPSSIGRYKKHDISIFDKGDIATVKKLGFVTE